ncbi:MAG: Sec-independent protein translocase protein TatB [Egibacteraceae bacterium]
MDVGFFEILMLSILALVIFGPERLPELAHNLGKMIAKFRREANSTLDDLRRAADLDDLHELRDLRAELRATSLDFKAKSFLTGPMASDARPTAPATETVRADLEPPYDTDAT